MLGITHVRVLMVKNTAESLRSRFCVSKAHEKKLISIYKFIHLYAVTGNKAKTLPLIKYRLLLVLIIVIQLLQVKVTDLSQFGVPNKLLMDNGSSLSKCTEFAKALMVIYVPLIFGGN